MCLPRWAREVVVQFTGAGPLLHHVGFNLRCEDATLLTTLNSYTLLILWTYCPLYNYSSLTFHFDNLRSILKIILNTDYIQILASILNMVV